MISMINQTHRNLDVTAVYAIVIVWALFAMLHLAERAGVVHEISDQDEQVMGGWTQALKSDFSSAADRQLVPVFLLAFISACIVSGLTQHQLNTQQSCPRTVLPSRRLHQLFSTYRI
ncbi:MAG: hypothetical protein ABI618_16220 [Nitrospirota bacterium]